MNKIKLNNRPVGYYRMWFLSFFGGFSFGFFVGIPFLVLFIAVFRKDFFGYSYVRELAVLGIWISSALVLCCLDGINLPRVKKVGPDGFELDYDKIVPIEPK